MLIYGEESEGFKVSVGTDKSRTSRVAGYYLLGGGGVCGQLPALKFGSDTRISGKVKIEIQTYLA